LNCEPHQPLKTNHHHPAGGTNRPLKKLLLTAFVLILTFASFGAQARFTHVATHPEAANTFPATQQAANSVMRLSHRGREIKVLRAFKNRLYIGYGQDDGPNLPGSCTPFYINSKSGAHWCPIILRYFDPATARLSAPLEAFRSQELSVLEVMNGSLYGLAEDQEGPADYFKCSASSCKGGVIHFEKPAHIYSATAFKGAIYMAGSIGYDGAIWKSTDNGNHWVETKRVKAQSVEVNGKNDFARFYDVGGPYQGKLYGHARDWYGRFQPTSYTYDGNSSNFWAPQSFSLERWAPTRRMREFAGKLVFIEGAEFKQFDGTSVRHHYVPHIEDYTISGEWLYVLNSASGQHRIMRTKDLVSWRQVDIAPSNAISLEVVGNHAYVGTTNAQIHKSDVDLDKLTIVITPILYLLLLDD